MKVYSEYKVTKTSYFEKIPLHWGTVPLKYVCYMKGRIGWQGLKQEEFTDKGPYLITGMNFQNGKMDWENCYHITQERFDEAPEIHVRKGDVLITKDGTIGKLLYIDYLPGPTSLNSHLLLLRPLKEDFDSKYLYYLLKSEAFLRHVDNVKTGTTFYGITQAAMGDFRMLIFDKEEQGNIVNFLDRKTAQIDTLIAKKQRQIELLQEHRIALINQAVTKGLNPYTPMKDSGIEWLGEVPAHWKIMRNKFLFREKTERSSSGEETLLMVHQKLGIVVRNEHMTERPVIADSLIGYKICEVEDLVLNRMKAHLGVFFRAPVEGIVSPDYSVFEKVADVETKYYEYLFHHQGYVTDFIRYSRGVAIGFFRLYTPEFYDLFSVVPPLDEQREILAFINDIEKKTTHEIELGIKEIELLQEYRYALISSVVTGKIDVREKT